MKHLKKLLVALLAACLSVSAMACGTTDGGSSTNGGSSGNGGKKKDFVLQIYTGGYGDEMWQYVIKQFEKDYKDKYNVIVNMSNTVNDSMANNWRKGNPPDFVFLDGTLDKNTWVAEGMLYDFTDWLKTATVAGEENVKITDRAFMDYAYKHTGKDGKTITYGMPLLLSSYGTWYDSAYFTKNNLTVPTNYEELKAWTTANATKNMPAFIYPGKYSGYLVQGFILPALAEKGPEFYNRVENALDAEVYTSAEFKEVMNRFAEFVKMPNSFADCLTLLHIESQSEWLGHSAAFIPNGLWLKKEMTKRGEVPDDFVMKYTSSPLCESKKVILTSSVSCAIAKDAKNVEAALEFVRYLYKTDVAQQFAKNSDTPSATNVSLDGIEVSEVLRDTQAVWNDESFEKISHVGSWGYVDSTFNQGVNGIVDGSMTVDEVCESLAAAARKQLGK